jgi:hypothetical protein
MTALLVHAHLFRGLPLLCAETQNRMGNLADTMQFFSSLIVEHSAPFTDVSGKSAELRDQPSPKLRPQRSQLFFSELFHLHPLTCGSPECENGACSTGAQ